MNPSGLPIVSIVTFLPLVGAILLYALPFFSPATEAGSSRARSFSLYITLATFVFSLWFIKAFESTSEYQFREVNAWIPSFGITYDVGIDGISLWLVLLTTFLMPIVMISSLSVTKKVRGYLANMLVLETAMLGTLVSLDIFLFYVFWELMLAPMYFIIGIWGGKRRIYATLKFVIYTVFGSLLMLVAIMFVVWQHYQQFGTASFNLNLLVNNVHFTFEQEIWLFAAFALAFAIKVPIFPFHTWLPDAHVEAPTGGSVVLAGVLLKMGLYGFIRFAYPLFPRGAEVFAPYIAGLAVIGIIYGALVAWAQADIKKLVAYSSVSHLGYCVLGFVAFNTTSMAGSIYQMLNHGISTPALFLLVGVLYDRKHTRLIADYGGVAAKLPLFAALFLIFTLSSIALPLTNGFVGEFMILLGSFATYPLYVCISVLGVILGAVYMLTLYLRTMFGELDVSKNGDLTDVNTHEIAAFAPLLALVFYMGLAPNVFLSKMQPTIDQYIYSVNEKRHILTGPSAEDYARTDGSYDRIVTKRI